MLFVKDKGDFCSSLFWMAVGALIVYEGCSLGWGALRNPGPGFIFILAGVLIIGFALVVIVQDVLRKSSAEKRTSVWSDINWKRIISVLISLIVFGYCFEYLGFIICTAILLLFLFKYVGSMGWLAAVAGAAGSAVAAYVIFYVLLMCQLPAGLLG